MALILIEILPHRGPIIFLRSLHYEKANPLSLRSRFIQCKIIFFLLFYNTFSNHLHFCFFFVTTSVVGWSRGLCRRSLFFVEHLFFYLQFGAKVQIIEITSSCFYLEDKSTLSRME